MKLDYSKLPFDRDGNPETPELVLKTLGGKVLGVIPGVHNLKLTVKYSEPSEIQFDVPAKIDGEDNPLYDALCGHKQIYTEHYGIYEILNPQTKEDGISETKHIKGYSFEKTLESKKFFLEEGTFNFWNPASPTDTVLGRILEVAIGWSVGYVSPTLIGRYRTFDSFDDYVLQFMYNRAPEKYRCVFVFDTYERTINAYDAESEIANLPIYLDFDNLVQTLSVTEKSDELVTALRPYGADELDIRAVNPIGSNWIYDLSYFIANGDISGALADKWKAWQRSVLNRQMYYKGLVGLQSSATARLLAEQAALTDLNGQLDTLISQQSVTIQAIAMEKTTAGKTSQQNVLNTINANISTKRSEIAAKQSIINSIKAEYDAYTAEIKAVVDELAIRRYFTDSEYRELSHFLIEQDITENTFVASTVDASISGESYTLSNTAVSITGSAVSMVDLTSKFSKRMYVIAGGKFSMSGGFGLSCDIIRGTLETKTNGNFVLSLYAGTIRVGSKTAASGMITLSGTYSGLTSNVRPVTVDGVTTNEGSSVQLNASGSMFLTANVSEYQKYSVQLELFDYAVGVLGELATPTYEFTVDTGNFLFAQEFAPFRNELELGKGVYLRVNGRDDMRPITPYIIEFNLDFEDRSKFSIVFSNRFKRPDETNTLKDLLEKTYSTSRSFDSSKYIYNQATSQASAVSKFMSDSLDAAKNTILAAANQSVVINGAGIHIGGDNSKYQLRLVDKMLAMTDDNWAHAKLAIGLFASPEIGEYWGVNAEVIGGKLIVGNNLIIENQQYDANNRPTGVMQFKVDATGAWLNNSTFVLQKDNGGKLIIDPKYGIVGGTGDLYTTSGTTVTPSFIDGNGRITTDADGMPTNSNFFLDIRDGNVYFRGHLMASSGKIGGFSINKHELVSTTSGYEVGVNGDPLYAATNPNYEYAFWAGSSTPSRAKFWVKKNGTMYAKGATLDEATINKATINNATIKTASIDSATMTNANVSGILNAPTLRGSMTAESGGELIGPAIYVPNKTNWKFKVTSDGNVYIKDGSISWSAVTGTDAIDNRITNAQNRADSAYSLANTAKNNVSSLSTSVDNRFYNFNARVDNVETDIYWLSQNQWTQQQIKNIASTQITSTLVAAPNIKGAYIQGGTIDGATFLFGKFGSIYDGYGFDGVNQTDLAVISSYKGMSLRASEGLGITAGYGVWVTGDVHIRVNGSWVNLNSFVASAK